MFLGFSDKVLVEIEDFCGECANFFCKKAPVRELFINIQYLFARTGLFCFCRVFWRYIVRVLRI